MKTLCQILGIEKPLLVWPGISFQTPTLVAKASEAGALGVLSAGYMSSAEIEAAVQTIRAKTDKPFAVQIFPEQKGKLSLERLRLLDLAVEAVRKELGLSVPDVDTLKKAIDFSKQWEALLDLSVPVIGLSLGGLREPYMDVLKDKGIKTFGAASNLKDSKVLVSSGVDCIVAQGWSAPGLRSYCECEAEGSGIDTLALLSQVKRAVQIPFVAEGSFMTKEAVKAVMSLGASGLALCDEVINSYESSLSDTMRSHLRYLSDSSSQVTSVADGRPSRLLFNGILSELHDDGLQLLDFPYQCLALRDIFKVAKERDLLDNIYLEWGQLSYMAEHAPVQSIINKYTEWMA